MHTSLMQTKNVVVTKCLKKTVCMIEIVNLLSTAVQHILFISECFVFFLKQWYKFLSKCAFL